MTIFSRRLAAPAPLQFRDERRATVLPCRHDRMRKQTEMGVLDAAGACIADTLLTSTYAGGREHRRGTLGDFGPAAAEHAGTAIYLGPLVGHYGHFLLDSLARVWFARRHPELPVVWSCPVDLGPDTAPLSRWQADILELIGLENPPVFVTAPTRFEHLIIPDLGYRIQLFLHPEHAAALAVVPHRPEPERRLWLSRSRLDQLQNLAMPDIEARLEDRGWQVIHPQTLSIPEQMAHLAAAGRVAGEQGSALHTLLFLKDAQGLRVDVFLRDPTRPPGRHNQNYETIARVKGFDQRMHLMRSETVLRRRRVEIEKTSSDISEYFDRLDLPPAPAGAAATRKGQTMPHDTRAPAGRNVSATRINRLAALRGARRYLEIGVASGQTFLNVEIEVKHGVDPAFRFDTRPLESERVRFFAMTSDRFFTEAAPRDLSYDIIFLDGLHTFEQTFRDFCASMAHAHADTVWIIDDVFPSDVFSALPSQRDALAFRKQHGLKGALWHGDVFKCVFAINDFFPNFSFRTLRRAHGNPQTVIINRPRPDFRPVFNDLEKISRLDYYGFSENRRLLRLDSEDAIFDWLDAAKAA